RGEAVGEGVGETLVFLRETDGDSSFAGVADFFAVGVGEPVGFAVGLGVGDSFAGRCELFFLSGVSVSEAKMFSTVSASDRSAASFTGAVTMMNGRKINIGSTMAK